jgi:hypothetical protein
MGVLSTEHAKKCAPCASMLRKVKMHIAKISPDQFVQPPKAKKRKRRA